VSSIRNAPVHPEPVALSRRRFVASLAVAGAALWAAPRCLRAQDSGIVAIARGEAAKAEITVRALRGNIHVLEGSGGNIGVLAGRDGALMVDAGFPVSRPKIVAALQRIGADPVKQLVNTHWHFDHTDGNEWLHAAGATIIAHDNTRRHLSKPTRVEGWQHTFPTAPAGALPTVVFGAQHRLHINGSAIVLRHYGPAHTDSDISVQFIDANVLMTGDTWWNGHFPFIDYSTGGSLAGTIGAVEANIAAVGADTLVVPGHGPVAGRAELMECRDMLVTVRDAVAALKKQGRTLEETIAAKPTARYDAKWGGFLISGTAFTGLVYEGV
jgi:glyoxylase-like metal-dependent hydrolase (beta-lactamase superfamily II)